MSKERKEKEKTKRRSNCAEEVEEEIDKSRGGQRQKTPEMPLGWYKLKKPKEDGEEGRRMESEEVESEVLRVKSWRSLIVLARAAS